MHATGLLMRLIEILITKVFFAVILFALPVMATYVAVLETGADGAAKEIVSQTDRQFLTNVLREQAVKELPAMQNYTIMTRENIQQMLPPGKAIEDCEGSCLVETGKNIAADYVCQARVGSFDGELTLSAELYETAGNKLIASFNGQGASMKDLLELVRIKSSDFFRSIKGPGGFGGVGGIGDVNGPEQFSFGGKKKFIVEIVTTPAGALPTIDGKGVPKCLSTPCKIQVEEGNHRFVVSKERYDDAEMVVDINENSQKVELKLEPNYGWLEIKPVFQGLVSNKGNLNVSVDDNRVAVRRIQLDPGIHNVRITHPCYDPMEFKASIVKQTTEVFNSVMKRGKGGLELNAEYEGEPQAVTVLIDGVESGSTPYTGEVPLYAEIKLKGVGWTEKVDVSPKWHEVVHVTHKLQHNPEIVTMIEYTTQAKVSVADTEFEEALVSNVDESIPTNVENGNGNTAKWVVFGISAATAVTGVVLAIVGNSQAKDAYKTKDAYKKADSKSEFERKRKDAESGQFLRGVGMGIAIVGAIGVGISFEL